jgi:hypothetical protein
MWEGGEDRKAIARVEREPNTFLVLYDVKQAQAAEVSQRRTAVSSKLFLFYYTCSDRLLTIELPSCSFHIFPFSLWRFPGSQLFCIHYSSEYYIIQLDTTLSSSVVSAKYKACPESKFRSRIPTAKVAWAGCACAVMSQEPRRLHQTHCRFWASVFLLASILLFTAVARHSNRFVN